MLDVHWLDKSNGSPPGQEGSERCVGYTTTYCRSISTGRIKLIYCCYLYFYIGRLYIIHLILVAVDLSLSPIV